MGLKRSRVGLGWMRNAEVGSGTGCRIVETDRGLRIVDNGSGK